MSKVNLAIPPVSEYDRAADRYRAGLTLEHYMEAKPQARQREITLASLALVRGRRPEVQYFNELLVLYLHEGRIHEVCPDNMVVCNERPVRAVKSFNVEHEEAEPLLVMEYVSESNPRKDYVDSYHKYEQQLRVPYYLLFYPEKQDLRVHRLAGENYELIEANAQGRLAIPELELELGILDGWVRYWFRGQILPLPEELRAELDHVLAEKEDLLQRAEQEKQHRAAAEAEVQRLRTLLAQVQEQKNGGAATPPHGP